MDETKEAHSCPFCDPEILERQGVLNGKLCHVLYCLTPSCNGNVLLIPKRHVLRFEELKQEEMNEMHEMIRKIAKVFPQLYKTDDYLLLQKNGKLSGQSVAHIHFHMIPTAEGGIQEISTALHKRTAISADEMARRTEELRRALKPI